MAQRRRQDYSRLVSLDLSPSEARHVEAMLLALLKIDRKAEGMRSAGCLDDSLRATAMGVIDRLDRQLKAIAWPADPARKAPFPV